MKYKKNRVKSIQNGVDLNNGDREVQTDDKQNNQVKRKKIEKDKQTTNKKIKKTNTKVENDKVNKEPIKRSDSPGIDLSIFQPRGKRKCVIQNELKKQRTEDWWSDDEDDDEEEEEEVDDKGKVEGANTQPLEEDDEVEEEIPDDDEDDEREVEIKDEDQQAEEEGEEEEEIEDFDDEESEKVTIVTNHVKIKSSGKKKPSPKQPCIDKIGSIQRTVRCFVFSTAMANRAGHAVSKGLFDNISTYHEGQKWETPYLTSEIHCRPFIAALEDELEKREQQVSAVSKLQEETNGTIEPLEEKVDVKEVSKERTLSVDSWQKEQVIQAAQRMGRVANINKDNSDDTKANPLHPRFHLPGGPHSNHRMYPDVKTELTTMNTHRSTDSESSPQTVPKIEKSESEAESTHSPNNVKTTSIPTTTSFTTPPLRQDYSKRYKNLNSPPPQLVPTINRYKEGPDHVTTEKRDPPKQYLADMIKEQVRYHSPKDFNLHKLISKPSPVPSLNQETRVLEVKNVGNSLESVEKARMEARMKSSPPILPRDIHPSAFISPREQRDGHARPPHFNGYTNGNSLFNPHLRPHSFSPPTSRHYQHSREAIENIVDFSRNSVIIPPPPVRPSVSRPNGFPESKTFEDYKPLSSIGTSIHQRKDRPSSLPIADIYAVGKEKKPQSIHSSFSVDSLTQSHARNERTADENSVARHIERRFPISSHTHPFHERLPIPPSHELHPHERLHIPNGINIHGLKRTLDEQLSTNILREQAERDRCSDQLRDWFWKDKERRMVEFERLLPTRPPFPTDPRSPHHVPPVYLPPRGVSLNGHRGDLPSPPHRRVYSPYARR